MSFDTKTVEGRKALDAAIAKKLLELPLSRGDVAKRLGVRDGDANSLRAVATALKRGVRDGWACVSGTGAWAKYAKGKETRS
jgi:hypothetical protein